MHSLLLLEFRSHEGEVHWPQVNGQELRGSKSEIVRGSDIHVDKKIKIRETQPPEMAVQS